jgi:hypothetical protein
MVPYRSLALAVVTLNLLGSLGTPGLTTADQPSDVCVLNISADGSFLGILIDAPTNFTIAVQLPLERNIDVPIPCDKLNSVALAVANQEAHPTTFSTQVFGHDGTSMCVGNQVQIPVNGARGVTFAQCQ